MTRALTALILATLSLQGCWRLEGHYDPGRCDPRCGPGRRCDEGQCVIRPDAGGVTDSASDSDSNSDQALADGAPAPDGPSSPPAPWTLIKKGSFWMGSPASDPCNPAWSTVSETRHKVTLTRDFELMTTEVSQTQFEQVMGYNNAFFGPYGGSFLQPKECPDCPIEHLSWHEAAAYCNALSASKGLKPCYSCSGSGVMIRCLAAPGYSAAAIYGCPGYRLPTEAEWEYAYRAGTTTPLYDGSTVTHCEGVDTAANKIGWYKKNAGSRTHAVPSKPPNPWGLYNMAGNVTEWCHDTFASDLGPAAVVDPVHSTPGTLHVRRGGYYNAEAELLRAGARLFGTSVRRSPYQGMRCARTR